MSTERKPIDVKAAWDRPLPGHYGILTMQLNITRYHPAGTLRWVLVVREPSSQTEISRVFCDQVVESEHVDAAIITAVLANLTEMMYLQTGDYRVKGAAPSA